MLDSESHRIGSHKSCRHFHILTGCNADVQVYYTTPSKKSEGVKGYWCHPCYNEHRGEVIELEGMRVRKVTCGQDLCSHQSNCSICNGSWLTDSVLASIAVGEHPGVLEKGIQLAATVRARCWRALMSAGIF